MAEPTQWTHLRNCKMVLCLPCGEGAPQQALRELGVPSVGLDADARAVAACRSRGLIAYAGSWSLLREHRHAFDGAWLDLAALPGARPAELLPALAESLLPGARLVAGGLDPASVLPADLVRDGARGAWVELHKARPVPDTGFAGPWPYRVGPYADLFVGCRRVLELGAGRGQFLDALRLREVPCAGIEPDAALAAAARQAGHDVVHGGLDRLAGVPGDVDGLFVGPWFGGLATPARTAVLAACRRRLAANGRLVVRCARQHLAAVAEQLSAPAWQHVRRGTVPWDRDDGFVLALAGAERAPAIGERDDVAIDTRSLPLQQPPGSPFDLERWERREHSQGGEDGVLAALFAQLGARDRTYVEFGCGDGLQCNTTALRRRGWRGLLMDGVAAPGAPDAEIHAAWITRENIEALLDAHGVPAEPDLLSIDLDGNDYWVWQAIARRPRVVVVEYNANLPADRAVTMRYDARHRWDGSDHYGASLPALVQLGRDKGYTLVHCTQAGVNAFFVRDDLLPPGERVPTAMLYRAPNYWYRGGRSAPDLSRAMVAVPG
ncbi:MAG TPA: hypothetical protein VFZ65_10155 [Planctomycetota bacterium]|nr:hypothetical protein [Planctomycetota bacterium]